MKLNTILNQASSAQDLTEQSKEFDAETNGALAAVTSLEVESLVDSIDVMMNAIGSIEDQRDMLLDQESLTAQGVLGFRAAHNAVHATFSSVLPEVDTESLNTEGALSKALTMEVEALDMSFKSIVSKVKEFFKKVVAKIKEFWGKHISSIGRLKKAAEALEEKANKIQGTMEEKELTISESQLRAMMTSGDQKVVLADLLKEMPGDAIELTKGTSEDFGARLAKVNALTIKDSDDENWTEFKKVATSMVGGDKTKIDGDSRFPEREGYRYGLEKASIIGGKKAVKTYVMKTVKNGEDTTPMIVRTKTEIVDIVADAKFEKEYEVAALDKGEISQAAKGVVNACDKLLKVTSTTDKTEKDFNKAVDKLEKQLDKASKKKVSDTYTQVSKDIFNIYSGILNGVSGEAAAVVNFERACNSCVAKGAEALFALAVKSSKNFSKD